MSIYNNSGDLAISEAQKRFFAENFPEIAYIEITELQTEQAIKELLPLKLLVAKSFLLLLIIR